jgi:ubiquinone/menaquinone biosynthesis C-methylase UbiE
MANRGLMARDGQKTKAMLSDLLWCPLHGAELRWADGRPFCEAGHEIPVEGGVPIFTEKPRREAKPLNMTPLAARTGAGAVDEFVDDWIVNTNGNLYWRARGRLPRYPIPQWQARAATGRGQTLVDVGCSWGRWTIAAARAGYAAWGVDVHLDALWAAKRVTREQGVSADFACCDAAHLPFKAGSVDFVFSYSVLQHLERKTVRNVLKGMARILRPGGTCFVQLPNAFGLMSVWRQARRGFREAAAGTFEMRYWTRPSIARAFREAGFGSVRFSAEGFLLQNTQREDMDLLSKAGAAAVRASCALRDAANAVPVLTQVADSLWVEATKDSTGVR